MTDTQLENIKSLQATQTNIKIWMGSIMGLILIIFFFTFATLVDKFPPIFFIIESFIALIFVFCFFMLNQISFFILKLTKKKHEKFKTILASMDKDDVDKKTEDVLKKFIA